MKRKDFDLFSSEIRRLSKQIDDSFVPNHSYGKDSSLCCNVATLRYVVDVLYKDLLQ